MIAFATTWLAASEPVVVQIGFLESVFGIAALLIGLGIAWGVLSTKVQRIDKDVDELKADTKQLTHDVSKLSQDLASVKTIVQRDYQQDYAIAKSPRQLTARGKKVLKKSGIKEIIDAHKDDLTDVVASAEPQNAYDAELCVLETVSNFVQSNDEMLNEIKEKTFALGEPLDIVFFVGGIYLRDYTLPKLGFKLADVDARAK